jgi:DNA primase
MPEKIDFAKLKATVPIDSVLARYGVQTKKRNNAYLVANCPLPSHTSTDSPDSFAINVENNLWTCHSDSCKQGSGMKGGDVIDLVGLIEGIRLPLEAAKKLVEWFPQNGNGAEHKPAHAVAETNKPLSFTLKDITAEHSMIQARGITVETARSFGVGFFPGKGSMAGRIVFPVTENGLLVAYIGRTCGEVTAENPKWRVPAGFIKSSLYGLDRCTPDQPLVIVESPWAVLWLSGNGRQAAALLGKEMTEAQERAIAPFKAIQLALDNDLPGREATTVLATRLRRNHTVIKSYLVE